jgi:hypothetical protein
VPLRCCATDGGYYQAPTDGGGSDGAVADGAASDASQSPDGSRDAGAPDALPGQLITFPPSPIDFECHPDFDGGRDGSSGGADAYRP